ncbi:MAG: antitoxin [Candidatus Lokiarchaeota archaeon]|nr:antitoxin [Candidatus Lokiarchaeota archaeon]
MESEYAFTIEMVYKNISLSEDAYARLKAAKRDDESFSEVVLRLLGSNDDLSDLFGVIEMSDKERDELLKDIESVWGTWDN